MEPLETTIHKDWIPKGIKTAILAATTVAANVSQELIGAVAGKKIRVLAIRIDGTTGTTIELRTAAAAISGAMGIQTLAPIDLAFTPTGWFETVAGEALNLFNSAGGASSVFGATIIYAEVG
jgi:hypothetical protein